MDRSFEKVDSMYELEIDRIVKTIKKQKSKIVLLQFPEGLKPYSQAICDIIEKKAKCQCLIWMGTCFGACDVPMDVERLGVDLIVQFGHSNWSYSKKKGIRVLE